MMNKNWQDKKPDPVWVDKETARLSGAVDEFARAMKVKLEQKTREGWNGWDRIGAKEKIYHAMLAHGAGVPFADGQEVDIANLAMMLWFWNNHQVEIHE
jgi:hypothetical protein